MEGAVHDETTTIVTDLQNTSGFKSDNSGFVESNSMIIIYVLLSTLLCCCIGVLMIFCLRYKNKKNKQQKTQEIVKINEMVVMGNTVTCGIDHAKEYRKSGFIGFC